jgi:hypothetical protein
MANIVTILIRKRILIKKTAAIWENHHYLILFTKTLSSTNDKSSSILANKSSYFLPIMQLDLNQPLAPKH